MRAELLNAFDALARHCEVSAVLCEEAGRGSLDVPTPLHSICTRLGLARARAADVERSLAAGQICGVFEKTTPLTWCTRDRALAEELAPWLQGARLYRTRVHKDTDIVDVALSGTFTGSKYNDNFRVGYHDGNNPFVQSAFGPSVDDETKELIAAAKERISAPSGSPFAGPVTAQDGSILIPEGTVPDYVEIESKMVVFVKGVVGEIPEG